MPSNYFFQKKVTNGQASGFFNFVSKAWPRLCSKYQRVKLDGDPKCFGEAIPSSACSFQCCLVDIHHKNQNIILIRCKLV